MQAGPHSESVHKAASALAAVPFWRFTNRRSGRKLCQSSIKFMNIMFAGCLGGWEWVIVILAVLILFGAKKIPELASGLGTGIKEFKKATREVTDEIQNAADRNAGAADQRPPPARRHRAPTAVSQSSNSAQGLTAGRFWHGRRPRTGAPRRGRRRPGQNFSRTPRRFPLGAHQERRRAVRGDAALPHRGQLRRSDHQMAVDARPRQLSRHEPNRRRQLRHEPSRQFSTHAGTAAIAEPRHEPFRRRHRRAAHARHQPGARLARQ